VRRFLLSFDDERSMSAVVARKSQESAAQIARRSVASDTGSRSLARGAQVDLALGEGGQLLVGRLLLVERLLQDGGAIVAAELLRPRDQAAIAGDLIVFGGQWSGFDIRYPFNRKFEMRMSNPKLH
jgi:hypothetical protein